ncbi:MAG TPA: hypothetical protein VHV82_07995 [Sporichthyaceae bacterium]|jgi:hypothetical protein|nr:hypothetical protein [Sporichthyaceae bacterium]
MHRRLQAALSGAAAAGGTAVVAVVIGRTPSNTINPTSVSLLGMTGQMQATFVVRGAGCPVPPGTKDREGHPVQSPAERVIPPTMLYTKDAVDLHFQVTNPGRWRCTGEDPGVSYLVTFPISPVGRTLLDADHQPPQPFPLESTAGQSASTATPTHTPQPAPTPTPTPTGTGTE